MMDADIWGDPFVFRPDRFINSAGRISTPPEFIPFFLGKSFLYLLTLFLFVSVDVDVFVGYQVPMYDILIHVKKIVKNKRM